MATYIGDTEYAASELFALIFREHWTVADYKNRRDSIQRHIDLMAWRLQTADDDDIPGGVEQAFIQYNRTLRMLIQRQPSTSRQLKSLTWSIETKSMESLPALSATIPDCKARYIGSPRGFADLSQWARYRESRPENGYLAGTQPSDALR